MPDPRRGEVGTDIASTLMTVAGDNPERLASEGAFAHLVGVAPIETSSGRITRYRLNPVLVALTPEARPRPGIQEVLSGRP